MMKVLIAEDNAASRLYLKDTLETQGYHSRVAENGLEALEIFKKWKPDLVLSDIKMPKMDGLKFLEEIRKMDTDTIVVMITAYGSEEYAIQALRSRANNYLKKPIQHSELLLLLEKYASIIESYDLTQKEFGAVIKPELSRVIDNDMKMVPKVVSRLILETGRAFNKEQRLDIRLGLFEVLMNSIEHGNLGITFEEKYDALKGERLKQLYKKRLGDPEYSDRRVTIDFKPDKTGCEWLIKDEGKGFNWQIALERADQTYDLLELNSRGVLIIQYHFDEVEYLGSGNQIRVRKNIKKQG